jgi:8-oxo-dGTP pyrophosphatase MutT (NUDIX family)
MKNDSAHSIKTVASREVYRNPWLRVREDEILRSNGQPGIYGVVDKDDCAIIVPIDLHNNRIWLVEQFRYTIQQRALELPQGGWEMEVENPEDLARDELRAEIGLQASQMTYLGAMWVAYGFTRQKQHVFLATGLTPAPDQSNADPEEHDLVPRCVPVAEFEGMMRSGAIGDGCTLAAWGLYLLWRDAQT